MTTQCSIPREETATAGSLDWTTGLQRCGYYYEGLMFLTLVHTN